MAGIIGDIVQKAQGLQAVRQNNMVLQQADELKKKQQLGQQALQQYYKSGGKDSDALINGIMNSPELAGNVLKGIGVIEKQQEEQAASDIARLWQTRSNPEAFRGAVAERVNAVLMRGGNPSDTVSLGMIYETDPIEAENQLRGVAAALEAKGYNTGVFSQGAKPMTEYQQASTMLRKAELDLKRLDNQEKMIDRQLQRETNELKRQELQQKITDIQKQKETASNEKSAQFDAANTSVDNMLNTINRVTSTPDDVIKSATGPISTRLPTLSADTADFEELVSTLGSQAFLSQIPLIKGLGALSNAEGEKLQSAMQNFSLRQSPERLKENLKVATDLLNKAKSGISKQYGKQPVQQQRQQPQQGQVIDWGNL